LIDTDGIIWASYRNGLARIQCDEAVKKVLEDQKSEQNNLDKYIKIKTIPIPNPISEFFNSVTTIFEDGSHNILVGGISGLFILNKNQSEINNLDKNIRSTSDVNFKYIRSIKQDKDNTYWVAAGNYIYHVAGIFSSVNGVKTENMLSGTVRYQISEDQMPTSLLVDSKGTLFVTTEKGIYVVERKPDKPVKFHQLDNSESDPEFYGYTKTIRDIYEDKSGVIWTAQDYYGVTKFNYYGSQFNSYKNLIKADFKSTDIVPIYKDLKRDLWIGTYGGGIYKLSQGSGKIEKYTMYQQKDNIIAILEFKPGLFWIGTDRGLVEFDVNKGKSGNPSSKVNYFNIKEIYIWDILRDNDLIYFATGKGLYVYNIARDSLYSCPLVINDSLSFKSDSVLSLTKLKSGEILIANSLQGLFSVRISGNKRLVKHILSSDLLIKNGIILDKRHRIFEDHNGIVWIADYAGLHRLDLSNLKITSIKLIEETNFPIAWSITEDNRGKLWIGTHYGLCEYDPVLNKVRVYNKSNGLPIVIHGLNSVYKDDDGRLYFGGIGGFYDFYPDSLRVNNDKPPVVITEVLLFNSPLKVKSPENFLIPYMRTIKLRYNQNNLTFKFASLDFNQPLENRYAYQLEGYQDQWTNTNATNRMVTFTHLKPGTYTFRIRGSNTYGVWNTDGSALRVVIRKPWWETYLAWSIYIIAVLLIIRQIFHWRLVRLKKEREELEKVINIRTGELENRNRQISEQKDLLEVQNQKIREDEKLKNRFFANISHEFRTPLSLILSPSEELLENSSIKEKEKWKLEVIIRNAQRLLYLVNQLLDLSRFDNNKLILEICEGDVMKLLITISHSFSSMAEVKSINFKQYVDQKTLISYYDQDKIEKILSNLLSNALKFTQPGGNIELNASYISNNDLKFPLILEIAVKDNGCGIPEESLGKIFDRFYQVEESRNMNNTGTGIGLSLAQDLARLMHGSISVLSKSGFGSIFTVHIPLGKDHLLNNEFVIVKNKSSDYTSPFLSIDETNHHGTLNDNSIKGNKKYSVLIVDDNPDLREHLIDSLSAEYAVDSAINGATGMNKALQILPDLIITDVMMPLVDGNELCLKIKENLATSHIPVIMLTAKDTISDKIIGLKTGADDYIAKPFNITELKARITNLIEQRRKLRDRFSKEIIIEPSEITITSVDEQFLKNAIAVVEKHLKDENFSMDVFRDEMNQSRSTLFRKLNALTGQSPTEFIRTIRLKRAATLLKEKFGNVSQVAMEVGFNDISYFNKSFKKLFGIAPSEYSKK
jgi:signal transduction histidine kinase/DNA-binding response OmpR family regulator/ligand-binding sensor domain-containing protein